MKMKKYIAQLDYRLNESVEVEVPADISEDELWDKVATAYSIDRQVKSLEAKDVVPVTSASGTIFCERRSQMRQSDKFSKAL